MDAITIPNVGRCPTLRAVIACTLLTAGALTSGCVGRHALAGRPDGGLTPVSWFAPADVKEGARSRAMARKRRTASLFGQPTDARRRWYADAGELEYGAGRRKRRTSRHRSSARTSRTSRSSCCYRRFTGAGRKCRRCSPGTPPTRRGCEGLRTDGKRDEVETIASALQMNVYYVPSMRNGSPLTSDEDRGNAILSTLAAV